MIKAVLLMILGMVCWGQRAPQLVPETGSKVPTKSSYTLSATEQAMGCIAHADRNTSTMLVDCSSAMPWSPKEKTVVRFCVVRDGERLMAAMVEEKSRIVRRCEVRTK